MTVTEQEALYKKTEHPTKELTKAASGYTIDKTLKPRWHKGSVAAKGIEE